MEIIQLLILSVSMNRLQKHIVPYWMAMQIEIGADYTATQYAEENEIYSPITSLHTYDICKFI